MRLLKTPIRFQFPAVIGTSILQAATAAKNIDATITMRSAETGLQTAIQLPAVAPKIPSRKPDLSAKTENV